MRLTSGARHTTLIFIGGGDAASVESRHGIVSLHARADDGTRVARYSYRLH